jgi:hypothetical protein
MGWVSNPLGDWNNFSDFSIWISHETVEVVRVSSTKVVWESVEVVRAIPSIWRSGKDFCGKGGAGTQEVLSQRQRQLSCWEIWRVSWTTVKLLAAVLPQRQHWNGRPNVRKLWRHLSYQSAAIVNWGTLPCWSNAWPWLRPGVKSCVWTRKREFLIRAKSHQRTKLCKVQSTIWRGAE